MSGKSPNFRAERLLASAKKTLEKGDRTTASELVVLAMTTDDAVAALDKLLPRVPEPEVDLTVAQMSRVMACVKELEQRNEQKIASQILAKIERTELKNKRKRKKVAGS